MAETNKTNITIDEATAKEFVEYCNWKRTQPPQRSFTQRSFTQRSFTRPSQDTQPPQRTTRPSFTQRTTRPSFTQRSFTRPSQDTQPPQRTTRPSFTQRSFTRPSQDTQQDTQPPQRLSYTELRNAVFDSNKRLFLHYFPGQYQKAIIFAKYCDANGLLVSYSMFDVRLSEFRAAFPPVDIEEEPHEPIEEEPHEPIEEETDADISKE